jgi:hypothetical protein
MAPNRPWEAASVFGNGTYRPRQWRRGGTAVVALLGATLVAGCGLQTERAPAQTTSSMDRLERQRAESGSILGEGGLTLGLGGREDPNDGSTGIGVNSFLWRASLDSMAFLPITQADPFGGVILTDWYTPPETPDERFKLNVFILDRALRADGVRVAVFRQLRQGGDWVDAEVDPATVDALEETILTRARELRVAALAAE